MPVRRHLVIFLRAPRLGRVKSRLARGIGALAALRFYRAAAGAVLRPIARDPRWRTSIAVTPDRRASLPVAWRRRARLRRQGGGDIGRRMARAFAALPPGPAVIIGSDIPAITPRHIAAAFRALGDHDAVFGPAADGGYWLVGMRRTAPLPRDLFRRVRWSTAHALDDTLRTLPRRFRVAFLETLEDVDDAASLARWLAGLRRRPSVSGAP